VAYLHYLLSSGFSRSTALANKKIVAAVTICYNFRQSEADLKMVSPRPPAKRVAWIFPPSAEKDQGTPVP